MESEQRVRKGGKWLWERIGKRPNHYWDCESMQVAAAVMLKLVGREAVAEHLEKPELVDVAAGA
jgi:hypothetical protein